MLLGVAVTLREGLATVGADGLLLRDVGIRSAPINVLGMLTQGLPLARRARALQFFVHGVLLMDWTVRM